MFKIGIGLRYSRLNTYETKEYDMLNNRAFVGMCSTELNLGLLTLRDLYTRDRYTQTPLRPHTIGNNASRFRVLFHGLLINQCN